MTALSHKWLRQVLTDRGVRAPSDAACAAFVKTLDPAGLERARTFLNAVTKGVESTEGMTAFLASINAAHQEAAPVAVQSLEGHQRPSNGGYSRAASPQSHQPEQRPQRPAQAPSQAPADYAESGFDSNLNGFDDVSNFMF